MDEGAPPAKRRRTSPRLSQRGSSEPQPNVAANTDTSTTATSAGTTTTPPDAPPQATESTEPEGARPRPPSFASPTRASLARHNPTILERRQSFPRESADDNNDSNDQDVEAMIDEQLGQSSAEKERETSVRPLARPAVRSPVRLSSPTRPLAQPALRSPVRLSRSRSRSRSPTRRLFGGGADAGRGEGGLFGAPPQKSPEAVRHRQIEGLAGNAIASSVPGSLLGEPPRRSPMKPVPRPLPPPDPQRSQDLLEPLVARDRQRSALDLFRVHEETQPEPELPPTPENVDTSALNMSPPGIHHSSTPTKRPRRVAARARGAGLAGVAQKAKPGTVQSSSPLKQPPLKATAAETAEEAMGNADALKEGSTNVPATRRGRGRPRRSDAARNIRPSDEDTQRIRERDVLQAEIAGLEADLALAASENARIRGDVERGDGNSAPPNDREILSLLRRRVLPEDDNGDETASASMQSTVDWLHAATNPMAFLPFGKPRADVAELLQFPTDEAGGDDAQPPLPVSHHPIEMTAAEELPFLQVFTPLAFRSEIVVLPTSGADASETPVLQKHIITASSTIPSGLFLARIEMTVHSKSLRITDLAVPRIEPPAAAAELKPLIERVTSDNTDGNSALTRNVTVLAWAMGEWVRVAVRRAKFWSILARKLRKKQGEEDVEEGDGAVGIAGMVEDIRRLRTEQRKRKRRKGNATGPRDESGDNDDGDDDADASNTTRPAPVTKVELLEHLGRTAMDIHVSASTSARVEWGIQFDWTGEAKSQIGLLVGVPGKWRKADKRGRLARLPKLFDQLVRDSGDPMAAVQTVVALLVGEAGL
ncbi:hypothetical protein SCUCBS95973_008673 [Sporothrix curviconia]|uniref:Uncharacterized protein n=1 Tax=Sporothrix curviconia TaxID=1260050 RepID=A0ABP0CQ05_9PEZI